MLAVQTRNKVLKVKHGASVENRRNELIAAIPLKACGQVDCGEIITVCCCCCWIYQCYASNNISKTASRRLLISDLLDSNTVMTYLTRALESATVLSHAGLTAFKAGEMSLILGLVNFAHEMFFLGGC